MSGLAVPGVYQVGGGGSLGHNNQQNGHLMVTNGATGSVPPANSRGKDSQSRSCSINCCVTGAMPLLQPKQEPGAGAGAGAGVEDKETRADTVAKEESQPEVDIVINNVVCSFSVRCHLNLKEIALNGSNVEYRKENGMVTMKLR